MLPLARVPFLGPSQLALLCVTIGTQVQIPFHGAVFRFHVHQKSIGGVPNLSLKQLASWRAN